MSREFEHPLGMFDSVSEDVAPVSWRLRSPSRVPKGLPDRSVCIVGLGYVGLTLAVAMAEAGFDVFGAEMREDILERLSCGEPHFWERGLKDKLRHALARETLRIGRKLVTQARVYIITVGTPLDSNRRVRTDVITRAATEVAGCLNDGDLVILRSTVRVGATRNIVKPILDETGRRYGIAYCPERTVEGNALEELRMLPQIVGGLTLEDCVRASEIFQFLTPTTIRVSDLETAELIKLLDNTQRDLLFAYSNEVARLADALGVSALEVIQAGRTGYPRSQLPLPGPVGGPCLEKDPYILAESLEQYQLKPELTLAARHLNERQPAEVVGYIESVIAKHGSFPKNLIVSILGIAFKGKPATDDLRGTMAKPIVAEVTRRFPRAVLRGWDAVVTPAQIQAFGLQPMPTLKQSWDGAHLVLILNNHPTFADMPLESLAQRLGRPAIVYDFWNHFTMRPLDMPPGTSYLALGSHCHLSTER